MSLRVPRDFDLALRELRMVVRRLGSTGGSITPSIYETSQVLRFCPQLVDREQVAGWLINCQQPDGGWGYADAPLYRTVPTLAALLALHEQGCTDEARRAASAGLQFLLAQDDTIEPSSGGYLPVAIELILPRLLDEAEAAGMSLPRARFQYISELNRKRLALIANHPPRPNAPPIFSWEAWGTEPDPALVGRAGGVGHSPAATAWWLHLARATPSCREAHERAVSYLSEAAHATGSNIRGIVPGPWPMNRFEQCFVLHMIVLAGLHHRQELSGALAYQVADLQRVLSAGGLGFSDHFAHDGDDTSAALAVLAASGMQADFALLAPFQRPDHFVAYPFEMHVSHAVTARATIALHQGGRDALPWQRCILAAQGEDGWWSSEKWNRSRLYGTMLALAALSGVEEEAAAEARTKAVAAFLRYQRADGGWGCFDSATPVETALGLLSLYQIARCEPNSWSFLHAVEGANDYLRRHYNPRTVGDPYMWISKDLYSARRVDHAAILCALLAPLSSDPLKEGAARSSTRIAVAHE